MWHTNIFYVKFRQKNTALLINIICMCLCLSKCYILKKKKVTPNGFLVWENTSSEQQNWLFLFCIRKYTYTWNCQCYFTMTEQNTSIRIVQLVHTITGLTIFLYPYFFFFKSLVLMEEVRAYPIFHISFTLFK